MHSRLPAKKAPMPRYRSSGLSCPNGTRRPFRCSQNACALLVRRGAALATSLPRPVEWPPRARRQRHPGAAGTGRHRHGPSLGQRVALTCTSRAHTAAAPAAREAHILPLDPGREAGRRCRRTGQRLVSGRSRHHCCGLGRSVHRPPADKRQWRVGRGPSMCAPMSTSDWWHSDICRSACRSQPQAKPVSRAAAEPPHAVRSDVHVDPMSHLPRDDGAQARDPSADPGQT